MKERVYRWLEFHPRPKKDGLHDSGYRYIRLVGAYVDEEGEIHTEDLHQWSDHVLLYGPTNIDVTEDGVIRIMSWTAGGGWITTDHGWFPSSAMFYPDNPEQAVKTMQVNVEVLREVYGL